MTFNLVNASSSCLLTQHKSFLHLLSVTIVSSLALISKNFVRCESERKADFINKTPIKTYLVKGFLEISTIFGTKKWCVNG